ncbi:MAG TPA: alpha/beta hydrolase [Phycisphaerae bacterium]|nr:alpha/beta hydrolase [Phycisphaerae bacterium]HRR86897.1 alpha/beta hydrolase [Phycisphaerae bacterium]
MLLADSFFYYPNRTEYERPCDYGLKFEDVSIGTPDGLRLHGWFFPAESEPAGTVLHLHGNAGNLTGHFQHVAWLPAAGWNVLCFDYRGYGRSEGRISRRGSIADANAALDWLLAQPKVDRGRIVAFGQSLGGAIGIVLTAQRPEIRGLIADGAFDHYRRIARWHILRNPVLLVLAWWLPLLMSRDLNPIDFVSRIAPRPILLMHGTADTVCPAVMARRLYAAAAEPKEIWLIEGANHYQAMQEMPEQTHPRMLAFFEKCVRRQP